MKAPKADADELIEALLTGDAKARRMAAGALGALGDARAVAPLAARLSQENDLRVVKALIGALGRFPTPIASSALMGLLRSRRPLPDVVVAATKALGAMGEVGLAAALDGLRDGPPVADRAARVLGLTGSPAATPVLAALLRGASAKSTRLAAAEALGTLRPDDAIAVLVEALDDEQPDVREAAALGLKEHGARGAAAVLPLLRAGGERAAGAAHVLAFVAAPPEAAADLVALALRRELTRWALAALQRIDGGFDLAAGSLPSLCAALDGPDVDRRYAAATTLSAIAVARPERIDDSTLSALLQALALPEHDARSRVAEALAAVGPRGAAGVCARLRSDDRGERHAAAEALAQSATIPPEAAPALTYLLDDEGAAVWAAEALARIGPSARGAVAAAAERGGEAAVRAARLLTRWA